MQNTHFSCNFLHHILCCPPLELIALWKWCWHCYYNIKCLVGVRLQDWSLLCFEVLVWIPALNSPKCPGNDDLSRAWDDSGFAKLQLRNTGCIIFPIFLQKITRVPSFVMQTKCSKTVCVCVCVCNTYTYILHNIMSLRIFQNLHQVKGDVRFSWILRNRSLPLDTWPRSCSVNLLVWQLGEGAVLWNLWKRAPVKEDLGEN